MKKFNIVLIFILILCLSGCNKVTPSDNISWLINTSSDNTSSDVSSDESSSEVSSNITESSDTVLSKPTSSKPASSKPSSSKQTSSKPVSSKLADISSAPVSSFLPPNSQDEFSEAAIEQKLFKLVNEERTRLGLHTLKWNDTLYKSAKIRSDEIAAQNIDLDISHTRPNGTSWATTLDEVNYSEYYAYAGENLAAVQYGINSEYKVSNDKLSDIIFNGWKNSKGHYEAIIRPETIEIGIAVTRNSNDVYATQHFGQIE